MEAKPSILARLSPILVRLVALWLMTGAGYKLFSGSPNDLPPILLENFPLDAGLTFRLAIAIELSIGFITLLRPRVGWILLSLQMVVFILILIQLIASGEASCGCFGSKITIPPAVMMTIDAVGLLLILVGKPWSTLPSKELPVALTGAAVAVSWAAPWLVISTAAPTVANIDAETGEWRPPDELPRYVVLEPETWLGEPIHETELAVYLNMDEQLMDGTWILYRVACEHCAEYLRQMYEEFDPNDPQFITLVRLTEEGEEESRQVDEALLPPHIEALLPLGPDWVITPPWRLELEGGVVKEVVFEGDFELEEDGAAGQ